MALPTKPAKAAQKTSRLFDQLENLYTKETPITTNVKPESIYMLNRFLSLHVSGLMASIECNQAKIPDDGKLMYLYYAIQKQPKPRITYPKVEKEKMSPRRKKAFDRVMALFCVNEFHCHQIMALLEQQGIKLEAD